MNAEDEFGIDIGYDACIFEENDLEDQNEEIEPNNGECEYIPAAYKLNDNISKYKQLFQMIAVYYHAKCGEPMNDVFDFLDGTEFITDHDHSLVLHLEGGQMDVE